jgi:hypothetical protein
MIENGITVPSVATFYHIVSALGFISTTAAEGDDVDAGFEAANGYRAIDCDGRFAQQYAVNGVDAYHRAAKNNA